MNYWWTTSYDFTPFAAALDRLFDNFEGSISYYTTSTRSDRDEHKGEFDERNGIVREYAEANR